MIQLPYMSAEDARAEARKLSELLPGRTFFVLAHRKYAAIFTSCDSVYWEEISTKMSPTWRIAESYRPDPLAVAEEDRRHRLEELSVSNRHASL